MSVSATRERVLTPALSVIIVIKLLGGAVPKVETPTGWIGTADRRRRKRGARRACYEELQRLVGPPVDRLAYAKVLDNGMCSSFPWEVRWTDRPVRLQSWRMWGCKVAKFKVLRGRTTRMACSASESRASSEWRVGGVTSESSGFWASPLILDQARGPWASQAFDFHILFPRFIFQLRSMGGLIRPPATALVFPLHFVPGVDQFSHCRHLHRFHIYPRRSRCFLYPVPHRLMFMPSRLWVLLTPPTGGYCTYCSVQSDTLLGDFTRTSNFELGFIVSDVPRTVTGNYQTRDGKARDKKVVRSTVSANRSV